MVYVEVEPGVRIFAQDLGEGDPVVLVPGFGMTHRAWDRQVRILTDAGHRVIAVDQRGHGSSDKPLDGYSIDRLTDDLLAVLDQLSVDRATVVGWSFGGQVAFKLAATVPTRVTRLVLVGSNAVRASRSKTFPFGRPPEQTVPAMLEMEISDPFAARRTTIRSGFGSEPDAALLDWMVEESLQMPSWAAIACYHSMLETDLMHLLDAVKQPVLQVIGEDDPVHSAKAAVWLADQLHDSTLVTIPDCGHYAMLEAPEELERHLLGFLSR